MAANAKKVLCTLIVQEIALHNEHPPRLARVDVEATSVAHALAQAQQRAMAQLKRK